jgi:hypothetical protein
VGVSPAWEKDFPKGIGHTSIAFLKRCVGFKDAKNGDLNAAHIVVSQCVKHDRLFELHGKYPCAVLLPVLGKNQLPMALAHAVGLPIWTDVVLIKTISRKLLCAIERLLHKPVFTGYIQEGLDYILVDDVISQGGTMAALRQYVLSLGGNVVAIVALAYAIGSHAIAPKAHYVVHLVVKFGKALISLLRRFGIAASVRGLTNSQAKYLLRFSSVSNIIKKLPQL